ncbi:MAG TPA: hypothetical protein VN238_21425 [Solirubrobacteraceae bacterium]|nr:hypothetical protein [Solirubrobacteraceae bacterium]
MAAAPRAELDHVSVRAADPVAWAALLGFAPPRAQRIHLAGAYLEVAPEVERPLVLIRPDDLSAAADALRAAGFDVRGPSEYTGRDGTWLDLHLDGQPHLALTRRTDLDTPWPPPEGDRHPSRARTLRAVHLTGDRDTHRRLTEALDVPGLLLTDARPGEPLVPIAADCGGGVVVPLT